MVQLKLLDLDFEGPEFGTEPGTFLQKSDVLLAIRSDLTLENHLLTELCTDSRKDCYTTLEGALRFFFSMVDVN